MEQHYKSIAIFNKCTLLSLLFVCFTTICLNGQPSIVWEKSLGGTGGDHGEYIKENSLGNYMMVGSSESTNGDVTGNHGDADYWVAKLNSTGGIVWEKSLGGSATDNGQHIEKTSDGGYIVAGSSHSTDGDVTGNHGGSDYWVVKLNSTGGIMWQKNLGGSSQDNGAFAQETNDGGYIVAGISRSTDGDVTGNHGDGDYWIVKLSSTGAIVWEKSLGGSKSDEGIAFRVTSDGNYIIVGQSNSDDGDITGNHGSFDVWVVKLSNTGGIMWEKSLGGTGWDSGQDIRETSDGGYVVVGLTHSTDGDVTGNHGGGDYWVVKLNSTGGIMWQKTLGGTNEDYPNFINTTSDGGYLITGYTTSADGDVTGYHGGEDIWVVKLTNTGGLDWQKTLGGTSSDFGRATSETNDGSYIVAGYSNSTDGDVTGNQGSFDCWIVKLSSVLGVDDVEITNSISLFPNPALDQVTLNTTAELAGATYNVYNNIGQVVLSKNIKGEQTIVETKNLPAGLYFIEVQSVLGSATLSFVKE